MPTARFVQVREQLWSDISANRFGDQLPPEPQLAKQYDVSRMTLRRAISGLVAEGFLSAHQGRGTFVVRDRVVTKGPRTIGLVIDGRVLEGQADPYFSVMIGSMAGHLGRSGNILVIGGKPEELVPTVPGDGARRPVSGMVAMGYDRDSVWNVAATRAPVVLLDSYPLPDRTCVLSDNRDGIRQAVRHLAALGHRRIAHIAGPLATIAGMERLQAWREAMQGCGLPAPEELVRQGGFGVDGGSRSLAELLALDDPPTAVVCANDRMALGALREARSQGRRVPKDLSLIGFDDIEAAGLADPPLTTITVDRAAMAAAACTALLGELEQDKPVGGPTIRLPVTLTVRASTARIKG
jgi:DNA-binding LacI/PurR family transcriptional regulator